MTEHQPRVYRNTGSMILLALFSVAVLIVVILMIIPELDDHPSAWFAFLMPLPFLIMNGLWLRSRLIIDDERVTVVNPWSTRSFEWNEIASFEASRTGPYGLQLVVHLLDGSWLRVTATDCGRGRPCRELEATAEKLTSEISSHQSNRHDHG